MGLHAVFSSITPPAERPKTEMVLQWSSRLAPFAAQASARAFIDARAVAASSLGAYAKLMTVQPGVSSLFQMLGS